MEHTARNPVHPATQRRQPQAEESGLRPGDRILAIDQQPVSNPEGAKQAISRAVEGKAGGAAKKSLLLLVEQQGRQHYLALSLKA